MNAVTEFNPTDYQPTEGLLDNTRITQPSQGRYIAHVAVPCRDLDEAARWYSAVLGAEPVRILKDRVTFSVMADFDRLRDHAQKTGATFLGRPGVRFAKTSHEHQTLMLVDPSGNVVEFKCYVRPECSY
jgi:extradiol dioxygenase family protein